MLVKLAKELKPARFRHSREVSRTAVRLAEKWGADVEKARVAGLLHDCARNFKDDELKQVLAQFGIDPTDMEKRQPSLLHARLGAVIAEHEYGVDDPEILRSIQYHTTGSKGLSTLEKVIYLADFIEPGRSFPGVERLRELAAKDLNRAMLASYDHTILFVLAQEGLLHPDTIDGRNDILMELKQKRNGR